MKYEDITYFEEIPEYIKLRDHVRKLYWRRSKADEITGILRGTCTNSNALKDLDLILAEYDVKVKNDKQAEELLELIMDLANNTRMGENNGHTRLELIEMNM